MICILSTVHIMVVENGIVTTSFLRINFIFIQHVVWKWQEAKECESGKQGTFLVLSFIPVL